MSVRSFLRHRSSELGDGHGLILTIRDGVVPPCSRPGKGERSPGDCRDIYSVVGRPSRSRRLCPGGGAGEGAESGLPKPPARQLANRRLGRMTTHLGPISKQFSKGDLQLPAAPRPDRNPARPFPHGRNALPEVLGPPPGQPLKFRADARRQKEPVELRSPPATWPLRDGSGMAAAAASWTALADRHSSRLGPPHNVLPPHTSCRVSTVTALYRPRETRLSGRSRVHHLGPAGGRVQSRGAGGAGHIRRVRFHVRHRDQLGQVSGRKYAQAAEDGECGPRGSDEGMAWLSAEDEGAVMGICKRLDHMDNIPKIIKDGWATALNEKYRRHSITPTLRLPLRPLAICEDEQALGRATTLKSAAARSSLKTI